MRQLSALDAQFLNVESRGTVAHIAGLAILDPTGTPGGRLTLDDLMELMRRRIPMIRQFRWRLAEVPLGLDHPYWIEDPDFDLEYHVREIALPRPGDDRQLADQVARLHQRPLDRARPLWEMYLVQGLEGGRIALYAKIHHALIDGVAAAQIVAALLDLEPEPRETGVVDDWRPERPPSAWSLLAGAAACAAVHPLRTTGGLLRAVPYLDTFPVVGRVPGIGAVTGALRTAARTGQVPPQADLNAPRTPFNGPITRNRRVAFGSLPLNEVKKVRHALGVSVNDVVMALCASALRRWLIDHDALPDRPLVAAVPVSTRALDDDTHGNQVSAMFTPLPTHLADPRARVEAMRDTMTTAKQRLVATPERWLQELTAVVPPAFGGLTAWALFRLAPSAVPPINLVISNVAGPQFPLYLCRAEVLAYHPLSVVSDLSGGLNITVFSYNGNLDIGLTACREMVPDVWSLIGYFADALEELKGL
ncbi:wax ester/triacylglycerol synthase family O-acyltransferase [Actinoallomurus sp. NPDC050550]|uniref:WS/DGAT/MGAT family O-acyltransferase n=1 Tax=Actinoallomurus sp. NPDC050550 TaxID=3154937 RepID=UPI0033E5D39F